MKEQRARRSARNNPGRRIEWTGTGGDSYLAVVVDAGEEIMDECWGTRKQIRAWVGQRWPDLPLFYAPMVYSPADKATANGGHANVRRVFSRSTSTDRGRICSGESRNPRKNTRRLPQR